MKKLINKIKELYNKLLEVLGLKKKVLNKTPTIFISAKELMKVEQDFNVKTSKRKKKRNRFRNKKRNKSKV